MKLGLTYSSQVLATVPIKPPIFVIIPHPSELRLEALWSNIEGIIVVGIHLTSGGAIPAKTQNSCTFELGVPHSDS